MFGSMAAFGATMTMPGIAGIILSIGMAVDANVIIFERIKEELENLIHKNIDVVNYRESLRNSFKQNIKSTRICRTKKNLKQRFHH